ncbi:MAG: DUF362 domain-containing protein [candidate division WOR-3 bacterium]
MNKSVVWFAPPERAREAIGIILEKSGFFQRTKPRKKIGIKVHFGEAGNNNHLDPEFVRTAVIICSYYHLQPVVIETTSLYRGRRQRASEHIKLAYEHGFTLKRILAPIEILDGEYGEKFWTIKLPGDETADVHLAQRLRYFPYIINLAHFKGHFVTGFGGVIKNLAMGLAAKAGKLAMHSTSQPYVDEDKCTSCGTCVDYCPHDAINFIQYIAKIGRSCTGCGGCLTVCPNGAIKLNWDEASESIQKKMAYYCRAVLWQREAIHFNFALKITRNCDCNPNTETPLIPDIGLFASFDPVACDQAAYNYTKKTLGDLYPHLNPEILLEEGARLGLGRREFELVEL